MCHNLALRQPRDRLRGLLARRSDESRVAMRSEQALEKSDVVVKSLPTIESSNTKPRIVAVFVDSRHSSDVFMLHTILDKGIIGNAAC